MQTVQTSVTFNQAGEMVPCFTTFDVRDGFGNQVELIEGKWYCGFDEDGRDQGLAEYVGEGQFYDDDIDRSQEMRGYSYLVQQG